MFKIVGTFQNLDHYGNPIKFKDKKIAIYFEPTSPIMWVVDPTWDMWFREVKEKPAEFELCHAVNRWTKDGMVFAMVQLWYLASKPLLGETTFESAIPWGGPVNDDSKKTLNDILLARDKVLKEYQSKGL